MTESLKKTGLLCLPFDGVLYGVELPYVIESVRNVRIASLPFLPEYYCGVCNRMGSITPVVSLARLGGGEEKPEHGVTVMLRCGAYDCGVLTQREPLILEVDEGMRLKGQGADVSYPHWRIKALYACGERKIWQVDVQKSLESMVVCRSEQEV